MKRTQSFCCGFVAVRSGKIKSELTGQEIATQYPRVDVDSFAQGVIDALKGDKYRYDLAREDCGIIVQTD